jgi:hypothetical protein
MSKIFLDGFVQTGFQYETLEHLWVEYHVAESSLWQENITHSHWSSSSKC